MKKSVVAGVALLIGALILFQTQHSFFSPESYLINLDRRKERLHNFTNEYTKSGLGAEKPFIRVEAVDGSSLVLTDIVSPEIEDGIKKIETTGYRTSHPQMTRGMIGCYKSHYKVWDAIYASGDPYGLVFEDDAMIDSQLYEKIPEFPPDWDVILLGHARLAEYEHVPYPDLLLVQDFWGLHGYLISRKGIAKMMLYRDIPISLQIDIFMSKLATEGKLIVYAVENPIVHQGNFGTDLQTTITPEILVNIWRGHTITEDV